MYRQTHEAIVRQTRETAPNEQHYKREIQRRRKACSAGKHTKFKSLIVNMEIHCPHFDQPDKRCGGADYLPPGGQLRPGPGRGIDGGLVHRGDHVTDWNVHVPGGGGFVRPDEPQTAADVHRAVLCPVFAGPRLCYHHPLFGVPAGGRRRVLHHQLRAYHRLRQRVHPPGPHGEGPVLLRLGDAPGPGGGPGPGQRSGAHREVASS